MVQEGKVQERDQEDNRLKARLRSLVVEEEHPRDRSPDTPY